MKCLCVKNTQHVVFLVSLPAQKKQRDVLYKLLLFSVL